MLFLQADVTHSAENQTTRPAHLLVSSFCFSVSRLCSRSARRRKCCFFRTDVTYSAENQTTRPTHFLESLCSFSVSCLCSSSARGIKWCFSTENKTTSQTRFWCYYVRFVDVDRFYIAIFSALEQTHCTLVVCDCEWMTVAFYNAFLNTILSGVFRARYGCYMAGATRNCCRLGAPSVHSIQPCTSLPCHFIPSHIRMVPLCLGVSTGDISRAPRGNTCVGRISVTVDRFLGFAISIVVVGCTFWVHLTTMHQFTVSLYSESHA